MLQRENHIVLIVDLTVFLQNQDLVLIDQRGLLMRDRINLAVRNHLSPLVVRDKREEHIAPIVEEKELGQKDQVLNLFSLILSQILNQREEVIEVRNSIYSNS